MVTEAGDVRRILALPLGMTPNGPVRRGRGEGGCLEEPAKKSATGLTWTCSWMSPELPAAPFRIATSLCYSKLMDFGFRRPFHLRKSAMANRRVRLPRYLRKSSRLKHGLGFLQARLQTNR